jgi:asparagine synthase (glutamine-hydrolysing)
VALAAALDRLWPLRTVFGAKVWQSVPSSSRQKSLVRRFKRFCEALRASPLRRYLDWIGIFNEASRAELYTDDFVARLPDADPAEFLGAALQRVAARDPVTAFSLADLTTYLTCDLMTKVDIASMAHSLECRQPFLDYRLVELAASFPAAWKFRRGQGKRILRKAFADLLPREVWTRRKMGFGVPLDHWFRHDLKAFVREVLMDPSTLRQGYFRAEAVAQLIEEHQRAEFNHGYRLWSLLFFELWRREWAG